MNIQMTRMLLMRRYPAVSAFNAARRLKSSKPPSNSSSGSSSGAPRPSKSPGVPAKEQPNIFREKTERAAQIHQELEGLLHTHYQRIREEQAKPPHHFVFEFMKKNRAEMINIAATFVCTILAYQVVAFKVSLQKTEKQVKEKEHELQNKDDLLRSLLAPEFATSLAERCNHHVQETSNNNSSSISRSWIRSASPQDYTESFSSILRQALTRRLGEAILTEEERKDQIQQKMQEVQHDLLTQQAVQEPHSQREPENVEVLERSSGETIVRTRNFSI